MRSLYLLLPVDRGGVEWRTDCWTSAWPHPAQTLLSALLRQALAPAWQRETEICSSHLQWLSAQDELVSINIPFKNNSPLFHVGIQRSSFCFKESIVIVELLRPFSKKMGLAFLKW